MKDKKREDSWNDEHDQILAETVLSHIRMSSTQLAAFEEVASKINRTAAACGFRWNKEIRKSYENELQEAKQNRSKRIPTQEETKKDILVTISSTDSDEVVAVIPREQPIPYEALQQIIRLANQQIQKYDELLQENIKLKEENEQLKSQNQSEDPEVLAKEDLDAFLQIMKRAKSLTSVNLNV